MTIKEILKAMERNDVIEIPSREALEEGDGIITIRSTSPEYWAGWIELIMENGEVVDIGGGHNGGR